MIGPVRITKHLLVSVTSVFFKKSCKICQTETTHVPLKAGEAHANTEIKHRSSVASFFVLKNEKESK